MIPARHNALGILFSYTVLASFALRSIASPVNLISLHMVNSTKTYDPGFPYTSAITLTDNVESLVGCFQQNLPQDPQLVRTNFIDCYNAAEQLAALDPHRLVHFYRNNDTAFELPNRITYRTCVILLDMVDSVAEDIFYVADIRAVAVDTARKCTTGRKAKLGGKGMAGPKQLVEVWVSGRP